MGESVVKRFESLEEGDHVLYNDKKAPLIVASIGDNEIVVRGPHGGEYMLYPAEDNPSLLLVSKPGNKQYASKVENLRIVGKWEQVEEGVWRHSITDAKVAVTENELGYWTINVDGFDGELPDLPKYGFSEREIAVEEAEKFIEKHPAGKTE